jgi:site-specific DNA-methyltransferase (adenine-specific)
MMRPEVATVLLSAAEARRLVRRIVGHLDTARALILELYEREGWRALGYNSWRSCVAAEFGQSQSNLYRQLEAARAEREISRNSGNERLPPLRDYHLLQIAQLPLEQRREIALELAPELSQKQLRTIIVDKQRTAAARRLPAAPSETAPLPALVRVDCGDTAALVWPSDQVHLIVTSIPYGLEVNASGYVDLEYAELLERIPRWAAEWYRVARKPGGRLVVVCPFDRTRPPEAFVAGDVQQRILSAGWTFKRLGIWHDGSAGTGTDRGSESPSAPNLAVPAEALLLFHAGQWRDPAEDHPDGHDLEHQDWLEWTGPRGLWSIPGAHHSEYPAVFPMELADRLIRVFSWRGATVADPMAGSGTVGAAALDVGNRTVWLNDINPHAVALIRRRLA